jgi:hypothetical protein
VSDAGADAPAGGSHHARRADQAFARANPVTGVVGALRALCLGGPTARPVTETLAGLLAVTVPAATIST